MRVFMDTEFTNFSEPELISIGLVAQCGAEFYAELSEGWRPERCSPFIVESVLPLLVCSAGTALSLRDASRGLANWLAALGSDPILVFDAPVDELLLRRLLQASSVSADIAVNMQPLCWPGCAMARHFELLLSQLLTHNTRRHHALVDARAMRQAVLQTEAEFRR